MRQIIVSIGDILQRERLVLIEQNPVILFEVLSDDAGRQVHSLLPPNYRYDALTEDRGLRVFQQITGGEWRQPDWLLVPEERSSDVVPSLY